MDDDLGKKHGHGQQHEKEPVTEASSLAQAVKAAHEEGRMEPPAFSEEKSKSCKFHF